MLTFALGTAFTLAGCDARGAPARAESARAESAPSAVGCRVVAPDGSSSAEALAACATARATLAQILAMPVPAGVVVLADSLDATDGDALRVRGEQWSVAVDGASPDAPERELGGGARLSNAGYIAHETAHRMATAMLYPGDSAPSPAPGGYGSALPDWADEALALLVEPAVDQQARLGLLFADGMIYALPLRRFLYMAHPALSDMPVGGPVRRVFYGQSLAFALFVRARAGDEGLRALVGALRDGRSQGVALTGIRGLPADGGLLEQEWLAWLRAERDRRAPQPQQAASP